MLLLFFINFFHINKMFKNSLAKNYQDNKERQQKKQLVKDIKVFLKKKKKKTTIWS